jgi:hypothetical protein
VLRPLCTPTRCVFVGVPRRLFRGSRSSFSLRSCRRPLPLFFVISFCSFHLSNSLIRRTYPVRCSRALFLGSVWSLLPAVRSLPQYTLYFHADDSLAPKLARVLMQVLHVEVRMRPLQRADCSADTDTDTHNSQEQALGAAFPFLVLGTTPTQSVATDVQVGFALMKLSPLVWFRFWARVSRMLMLDRLLEFGVYLLPMSESADLFLDGLLRWQDQSRVTVWQRRGRLYMQVGSGCDTDSPPYPHTSLCFFFVLCCFVRLFVAQH